jgi:hypothetical protein
MNLLLDAMFAAALNDFRLGDRPGPLPERLPEQPKEAL